MDYDDRAAAAARPAPMRGGRGAFEHAPAEGGAAAEPEEARHIRRIIASLRDGALPEGAGTEGNILFFGIVGSGKTTLFHLLTNPDGLCVTEHRGRFGRRSLVISSREGGEDVPIIGEIGTTRPFFRRVGGTNISYVDLPGFFDNRGATENILNQIERMKIFQRPVKLVFVVCESAADEDSRGHEYRDFCGVLESSFEFDGLPECSGLVLTKALPSSPDIVREGQERARLVREDEELGFIQGVFQGKLLTDNDWLSIFSVPTEGTDSFVSPGSLAAREREHILGMIGGLDFRQLAPRYVISAAEESSLRRGVVWIATQIRDILHSTTPHFIEQHLLTKVESKIREGLTFSELCEWISERANLLPNIHLEEEMDTRSLEGLGAFMEEIDSERDRSLHLHTGELATVEKHLCPEIVRESLNNYCRDTVRGFSETCKRTLMRYVSAPELSPEGIVRGKIVSTRFLRTNVDAHRKFKVDAPIFLIDEPVVFRGGVLDVKSSFWWVTADAPRIDLQGEIGATQRQADYNAAGAQGHPGGAGGRLLINHVDGEIEIFPHDRRVIVNISGGDGGDGQDGGDARPPLEDLQHERQTRPLTLLVRESLAFREGGSWVRWARINEQFRVIYAFRSEREGAIGGDGGDPGRVGSVSLERPWMEVIRGAGSRGRRGDSGRGRFWYFSYKDKDYTAMWGLNPLSTGREFTIGDDSLPEGIRKSPGEGGGELEKSIKEKVDAADHRWLRRFDRFEGREDTGNWWRWALTGPGGAVTGAVGARVGWAVGSGAGALTGVIVPLAVVAIPAIVGIASVEEQWGEECVCVDSSGSRVDAHE